MRSGNNGELMKPRLVKEIVNDERKLSNGFDPQSFVVQFQADG